MDFAWVCPPWSQPSALAHLAYFARGSGSCRPCALQMRSPLRTRLITTLRGVNCMAFAGLSRHGILYLCFTFLDAQPGPGNWPHAPGMPQQGPYRVLEALCAAPERQKYRFFSAEPERPFVALYKPFTVMCFTGGIRLLSCFKLVFQSLQMRRKTYTGQ